MHFIPPRVTLFMLKCLDSYSPEETASVESFLDTYIQVVMLATKSDLTVRISLNHLISKKKEVDKGYKQGNLTLSTFVKFYTMLGQHYTMNGYEKNSRRCHAHILTKTKGKLKDCYPRCDYFSISVAYESIGDKVQAFHFRKLAYRHQFTLTPMNMIKLQLLLYNDYSNTSLGNDVTEAKSLSSLIILEAYPYLMNAGRSEYSEEIYYAAMQFFRRKNIEENVIQLQKKIIDTVVLCDKNDCFQKTHNFMYSSYAKDLFLFPAKHPTVEGTWCNIKCALIYGDCAVDAYKRQYYYLAIWSGEQSFNYSDKLGEEYDGLGCASSLIVGKSYYHIGNYSAAKMWLNHALKCFKKAHRPKYMYLSATLSEESGESLQMSIYFLIFYELYILLFISLIKAIRLALLGPYYIWNVFFPHQEVNLSTETALTEQKYSFVLSQFNTIYHNVYTAVDKYTTSYTSYTGYSPVLFFPLLVMLCLLCLHLPQWSCYPQTYMYSFCTYSLIVYLWLAGVASYLQHFYLYTCIIIGNDNI